jgi:transcription initiation factor IIE alpha subunit
MAKINLVRRPSLVSPRHFLRYIFFTELQIDQAAKILDIIMKHHGELEDSRWEELVLTSRGLYVKVMRKLRDVGIIKKDLGKFKLSNDFSNALGKLASYWLDTLRAYETGDRSLFS